MQNPQANVSYIGVPYNLVVSAKNLEEQQPMLQSNGHPRGYKNSHKFTDMFYYISTRLASFFGIASVAIAVTLICLVLFTETVDRLGYQTTTFLTTTDKTNVDSWQVLTSSWSELTKTTPSVDVYFEHYYECLWKSGAVNTLCNNNTVNDYTKCIKGYYQTQLTNCDNVNDENYMAPSLNYYVQCLDGFMKFSRQTTNALTICLRTNQWPLYESPENIDSWYFLGSYNWMLFLTMGFALFACFALYTGGFVYYAEDIKFIHGSVGRDSDGPLSRAITMGCCVFSVLFLVFATINGYRQAGLAIPGTTYPLSNSVATNSVLMTVAVMVATYFIMEWMEFIESARYKRHLRNTNDQRHTLYPQFNAQMVNVVAGGMPQLDRNIPHRTFDEKDHDHNNWGKVMEYYYPALTIAWADAYMLDPVIAAGVIGATHQITTSDIYQFFVAILAARMAFTSVARLLYEGYIENPDEETNKDEYSRSLYNIRMQAVFMHISVIVAIYMAYTVLTNPNKMISEYALVSLMLYTWWIVPEAIRFLAHLRIAMAPFSDVVQNSYTLYMVGYLTWIWDIVVRLLVVILVYWGPDTMGGTRSFVSNRLQNITNTVIWMG
jgi:hypothetical protein